MHGRALRSSGLDPADWRDWSALPGAAGGELARFTGAYVQHWQGTSATMRQPALDHHMIVLHRGGPKRVTRNGQNGRRIVDVEEDSITTVESGSVYSWETLGPIAFVHLFVTPERFAALIGDVFDRDPASISFAEVIGRSDPHAAALLKLIVDSINDPEWAAVADTYLDAILVRIAATSGMGGDFAERHRIALTAHTVRKVQDYINAFMHRQISLDDLASVAGYSRYHFVRAFRDSMGMPPYTYMLQERIAAARHLLQLSDAPIGAIARQTGFASHAHFTARFRRVTGITPAAFRKALNHREPDTGDAGQNANEGGRPGDGATAD